MNKPSRQVWWDFHELRVRLTHYTIQRAISAKLRSWIVESSLDGGEWVEIDREPSLPSRDLVFRGWSNHSFAVAGSPECRFIRVTHRKDNSEVSEEVWRRNFEIFGTLLAR
jgi:hypothetical protein